MADFQVTADVDIILSDAEIRRTTRDLQRRMASALKPLQLKIQAPALRQVNQITAELKRNMQGLISDTNRAQGAFRTLGNVGSAAFRQISAAKDALRRNIRFLESDLKRLSGSLRTDISQQISRQITITPNISLPRNLSAVPLPVIPFLRSNITLQPLAVPIIPVLSQSLASLSPITVLVVPVLDEGALAEIRAKISTTLETAVKGVGGLNNALDAEVKLLEEVEDLLTSVHDSDFLSGEAQKNAKRIQNVTKSTQGYINVVKVARKETTAFTAGMEDMNRRIEDISSKKARDLLGGLTKEGPSPSVSAAFLGDFEKRLPKISELLQNARFHLDKFLNRFKDETGATNLFNRMFGKGKKDFDAAVSGLEKIRAGLKPLDEEFRAMSRLTEGALFEAATRAGASSKEAARGLESLQKQIEKANRLIDKRESEAPKKAQKSAQAAADAALRVQEELDSKIRQSINTQVDAQKAVEPVLQKILADRVAAEKQANREIRRASKSERDDQSREAQAAIDRATEVEAIALKKQQAARAKATKDLNNQIIQSQRSAGEAFQFKFNGLDEGLRKLGLLKDESNKLGTDDSFKRYVSSLEKAAPALGLATKELDNLVDVTRRFGHFVPPGGFEIVSERNRDAARNIVREFSNATKDAAQFEKGLRALNRTFGISLKDLEEFAGRSIKVGSETGALGLGFIPSGAQIKDAINAFAKPFKAGLQKALDLTQVGVEAAAGLNAGFKLGFQGIETRGVIAGFGKINDAALNLGNSFARAIDSGLRPFGLSMRRLVAEGNVVQAQFAKTGGGIRNLTAQFKGLVTQIGASVAGFAVLGTVLKGINQAANLEALKVSLSNVLAPIGPDGVADTIKGAQLAAQALTLIRDIAAESGLSIDELTKAFQKLVAQGFSVEKAAAQVELLARAVVSSGGGVEEFGRAATALTQILSKGQLQYEEFRGQLAEAIPSLNVEKFATNLGFLLDTTLDPTKVEDFAKATKKGMEAIESGTTPANIAVQALNQTFADSPGVINAFETRAKTLRGTLDRLRTQGLIALEKATGGFVKTLSGLLDGFNFDKVTVVLTNLFDGLAPILGAVAQAFVRALPLLEQLSILFKNLAPTVAAVASIMTGPLIQALTQIVSLANRLAPLLQIIVARFVAMRIATTVLQGLSLVVAALPARFAAAGAAATALGARVAALAGPIGVGIAAFLILSNIIDKALGDRDATGVQEAIENITNAAVQGKGGQELADAFIEDFVRGLDDDSQVRDRFTKLVQVNPGAAKQVLEALKATNTQIFDEKGNLVDLEALYQQIVTQQKKQNDELLRTLGLTDAITDSTKDYAQAAKDAKDAALKGIKDALSQGQALISAQQKVEDSKAREGEIQSEIADLQKELTELTKDQAAKTNEVLEAKKQIADIDRQIRDLLQSQNDEAFQNAQRLDELADRRDDFADRLVELGIEEERLDIRKQRNLEEINRLQEEGVEGSSAFVNIAGLSLDAARQRLAAVRSTLAAQRSAQKAQGDETDKALDLRDAKLEQQEIALEEANQAKKRRDLERERIEFEQQNRVADREHIDFVKDTAEDLAQLRRDRIEAEKELTKILNGQGEVDKEILRLKNEIKKKQEEYKKQVQQTTVAEAELNYELALASGHLGNIAEAATRLLNASGGTLKNQTLITDELNQQKQAILDYLLNYQKAVDLPPLKLDVDISDAQKKFDTLSTALKDALKTPIGGTGLLGVPAATDIANGFPVGTVAEALAQAASLLNEAANRAAITERNLADVARKTGTPQRAFALGGYIPSAGPFGETVRVAEAGAEAILPLTNPSRMRAVVNDPRVLDPVLAALPQVQLPSEKLNKSSGEPVKISEQERRKQQKELAGYLADAIVSKAGDLGKDVVINQTFETGQYIDTNQLARKAAREAERQWRNRNT